MVPDLKQSNRKRFEPNISVTRKQIADRRPALRRTDGGCHAPIYISRTGQHLGTQRSSRVTILRLLPATLPQDLPAQQSIVCGILRGDAFLAQYSQGPKFYAHDSDLMVAGQASPALCPARPFRRVGTSNDGSISPPTISGLSVSGCKSLT